jgi:hypothetical protein
MLTLLFNIVVTGIEALVMLGNKFLYACVKEAFHLRAHPRFDTIDQPLIIIEVL